MKISELAELSGGEISRMSNEELTSIIRTAGWKLNKRAKRLESENLSTFSPAYRSFSAATGGRRRVISYGKNQAELRHQVIAARNFARAKTSTITGAKKEKKRTLEIVKQKEEKAKASGSKQPGEDTKKGVGEWWDDFKRFRESFPEYGSDRLLRTYRAGRRKGQTLQEIIDHQEKLRKRRYKIEAERRSRQEKEEGFFSNPFDIHH